MSVDWRLETIARRALIFHLILWFFLAVWLFTVTHPRLLYFPDSIRVEEENPGTPSVPNERLPKGHLCGDTENLPPPSSPTPTSHAEGASGATKLEPCSCPCS